MGDGLKRARAAARASQIVNEVAEALRSAGHTEATADRTGFHAAATSAGVIVTHAIDDHAEGHWDSPAHHRMQARACGGYRQALEAAGWTVKVSADGEGLTVTRRAKAA